jgi:hypothetical protein
MRAVDGEDLKLRAGQAAHPAGYTAGLAIPGRSDRITIVDQACLSFREVVDGAERNPGVIAGALP